MDRRAGCCWVHTQLSLVGAHGRCISPTAVSPLRCSNVQPTSRSVHLRDLPLPFRGVSSLPLGEETLFREQRPTQPGWGGDPIASPPDTTPAILGAPLVPTAMKGLLRSNGTSTIHTRKDVKVLVVPGNPGHAGFYRTFQQALQERLGSDAWVSCISHRGHGPAKDGWNETQPRIKDPRMDMEGEGTTSTPTESSDGTSKGHSVEVPGWLDVDDQHAFAERPEDNNHPHSLASQCSYWKEVAQSHVSPGDTLVLVGHSIGAYIAMDAASRVQGDVRVVGVMPFLRRDGQSQHQRWMQQITSPPARFALGLVASILSKLPRAWRVAIIRRATSPQLSTKSSHTVADWIHEASITAALRTAAHEFHDLAPQRLAGWHGWQWLSREPKKPRAAFFYGADGDVWANPRDAIHLSSRFPHAHIKMFSTPGLRHDFCVDDGQSHAVAEDVAGWIRDSCLL